MKQLSLLAFVALFSACNLTTQNENKTAQNIAYTIQNKEVQKTLEENIKANQLNKKTTASDKKDTTAPKITLFGPKEIILDISQEYKEPGFEAIDDVDGNLTARVHIKNKVQEGVEGNYTIIYRVKDKSFNKTKVYRYVIIKDRLKELDTSYYKKEWFEKAKAIWNKNNPNNPYSYNYFSYKFPANADKSAGAPKDKAISPKKWMQTAGLGLSKFLKYPFEESKYQYNDALVKEWKKQGFRNGRLHVPLYAMVDLEKDPSGATLKEEELQKIKNIAQLFVDNNIPITISIVSGDRLSDDMLNDRNGTFQRTISWWRQFAAYFKDMSYLVAFENYVEYHGFDDVAIEKKDFKVYVDNNETHYKGFKNYRNWAITNWVRTPGYNNLLAEIAKVVRITNPKRIMIYKPNGIGRVGLVNITPWRWGPEGDYLQINNKKTPYWIISSGGSANLSFDYIKAIRSDNQEEKESLLVSAKEGTWGPLMNYYNATKIPVWISLFGIKAEESKIESKLNGIDVTTDELVSYINWYQSHLQNDAKDENNKSVKISSGFQQTPWIWDFKNQKWFEGTLNERWENFERVRDTLSKWAKKFD